MTPTMYLYLSYRDAAAALRFFEEAFGFATSVRWDDPGGTVQHAEVTFGEGALMMGTVEHPSAPLEGVSVGQGDLVSTYIAPTAGSPSTCRRVRLYLVESSVSFPVPLDASVLACPEPKLYLGFLLTFG